MNFIESIFVFIILIFDKLFIWLIENLYNLLLALADVNIFGEEVIKMFGNRIYALLAIFMLFKISFTLINYLINPDDFSAKDKGFGSIIKNTMIAILLIVFTPMLFSYAFKFQGLILKNQTINRLILGVGGDIEEEQSKLLTFSIYSAFFKPNEEFPAIKTACENVYITRQSGYNDGVLDGCALALSDTLGSTKDQAEKLYIAETFDKALSTYDTNALLSSTLYTPRVDDKPLFEFKVLIGTFVSGFVAIILLNFAFDIAIRSVKLGFLQLIAPIPIVSYIDPKSKDKIFKKWYQEVIKTYLDLFIRLIAVFFAIFIISLVAQSNATSYATGEPITMNPFVFIFIIIGALTFAKQIPKLIEDLTGMKLGGSFKLNPLDRIRETPGFSGAAGAVLGSGSSAFARYKATKALDGTTKDALLSGAGGAFLGGLRGLSAGNKAKGKDLWKTGVGVGTKAGAQVYKNDGTTFEERFDAKKQTALGGKTKADAFDSQIKLLDTYSKHAKAVEERAYSEIAKKLNTTAGSSYKYMDRVTGREEIGNSSDNIEVLKNKIEALKASGASAEAIATSVGQYKSALEKAKENYITKAITTADFDAVIKGTVDEMNDVYNRNKSDLSVVSTPITKASDFDANKKAAMAKKTKVEYGDDYKQSVKVRDAIKK